MERKNIKELLGWWKVMYLGEVKGLWLIPVGLQEGVIGQPERADTARRLVQCDMITQGQHCPVQTIKM